MTEEELTAIEARATAATMGPWDGHQNSGVMSKHTHDSVFETGCGCCTNKDLSVEDATFIAAARADVPALVAEVRRLRRAVELAYYEAYNLGAGQVEVDAEWAASSSRKALEAA